MPAPAIVMPAKTIGYSQLFMNFTLFNIILSFFDILSYCFDVCFADFGARYQIDPLEEIKFC